jgi:geranylgeranyl reductase family protein
VETCDVLVVGGGPGGSSIACALRDAGLDVVVMDRSAFPRDKICAGWITPQILEELAVDPELYAKGRVLQPIHGFRVRRVGDPEARSHAKRSDGPDGPDEPISYGIRRCEFDHFLLERAEARLRLGEPLGSLERRGGRWRVNGALETPVVVGAGGHFCPVARRLGAAGGDAEPIIAAQELEFELPAAERDACPIEPEVPEIFFTADLKGYGWVFRKGHYLNVGLGRQDRGQLSGHFERFLAFLRDEGRLPGGLPRRPRGHAYLLYGEAPRRWVGDGVLLVGDAAGLAYPRSGEGIRPAVESGLLAARQLASATAFDAAALAPYAEALQARFGAREKRLRVGLTDLLPEALVRRLAGRLFANPWFARHVVVDRWFVHAHEPALAP